MRKVFLFEAAAEAREIADKAYDEVLAALRHHRPEATSLLEDEDFFQLHGLLVLLRMGQLRIQELDWDPDIAYLLELREETRSF
ncbi:MAG: hypothetical protein KDK66_02415 [Deltaproteobacteria bacterium]|nr:hypothetical protein [Deltaproteobacteria bacterium]